jgi:Kef-type K+ transport system membrane component KefB
VRGKLSRVALMPPFLTRRLPVVLFYLASLVAAAGIFLVIRSAGLRLLAPQVTKAPESIETPPLMETPGVLLHVLLALVVIVIAARTLGSIFRWLHQPQVMGEVVAGLVLGPSVLGGLAPQLSSQLLPPAIAPFLTVIAQVGVILFMFLVGLELDTGLLRQRTRASIAISHASIVVPFLLGAGLALWLYPRYAVGTITFTAFALFIGVAMSVTAFPALARILTDTKMQTSRMGVLALACAAVDDVTAWCLLALVVGVARAQPGRVLVTVSAAMAFILFVLLIVSRGAMWLVRRQTSLGKTTQQMFATVCVALLFSALVTERIGIHALFGAFLLGAVVPHDSHLARDIREKCEDLVVVLLLPVFFVFTGMRTQVGLLKEPADWLVCVVIILIASVGKFGGSFFAAHITGSDNREAATLGILMNTRGLMELVVLNVGLDLGVLSPTLFAMFVLMAVVTTLATTPILQAISPRG